MILKKISRRQKHERFPLGQRVKKNEIETWSSMWVTEASLKWNFEPYSPIPTRVRLPKGLILFLVVSYIYPAIFFWCWKCHLLYTCKCTGENFFMKAICCIYSNTLEKKSMWMTTTLWTPIEVLICLPYIWLKVFRINPEFRILRLTFIRTLI